jgi:hypothetical protein
VLVEGVKMLLLEEDVSVESVKRLLLEETVLVEGVKRLLLEEGVCVKIVYNSGMAITITCALRFAYIQGKSWRYL